MLLAAIAAVGGFFAVTGEIGALAAGGSVLVLAVVWTAVMHLLEKKELEGFMADIGRLLDTMEGIWNQKEEICPVEKFREITGLEEETLLSRLGGRFCRLYEMMDNARTNTQEDRKKITVPGFRYLPSGQDSRDQSENDRSGADGASRVTGDDSGKKKGIP